MQSPREVQRAVFAEQVGWARERGLPVTIHVRGDEPDAFDELLDIWTAERGPEVGGVLHCYTGTLDFARRALDAELDVSFSGILTFKRDRGLREIAAALPLERLLVETDAPLLAPEGHRGPAQRAGARRRRGTRARAGAGRAARNEVARVTRATRCARFRLPQVSRSEPKASEGRSDVSEVGRHPRASRSGSRAPPARSSATATRPSWSCARRARRSISSPRSITRARR
jgi:Tat protein secretion system quality control protein TatD with DNase activity